MVKISVALRFRIPFNDCKKALSHYLSSLREQLSGFERGRIIGLKEAGWANRIIARHMGRSDVVIRRCWQEWVGSSRFQRHDGSG
ncbi:HTH_Tnp_Tc3_2 domain-containing protein [Trichonephila clavipes]|nr:HTH_Tnp_Tc3_2 domain-containing protein [Trichonephila clavipes]